jgi:hypothetical protein
MLLLVMGGCVENHPWFEGIVEPGAPQVRVTRSEKDVANLEYVDCADIYEATQQSMYTFARNFAASRDADVALLRDVTSYDQQLRSYDGSYTRTIRRYNVVIEAYRDPNAPGRPVPPVEEAEGRGLEGAPSQTQGTPKTVSGFTQG